MFNCPYAANAVNLGALSEDEAQKDTFSIFERKKQEVKSFLFDRKYLMACDYCNGRNFNRASIEPHVQITEPLEYVKRNKEV